MKKFKDVVLNERFEDFDIKKYLIDNQNCKLEGTTKDGKPIFSCKDASSYKLIDDNGNFKVQFNEVGYMDIHSEKLTSLEGSPLKVETFDISFSPIKNMIGITDKVKNINLVFCGEITSLEGMPRSIDGDLKIGFCKKLTSLKGIPKYIKGDLVITHTEISNLEHFPKYIGGNIKFDTNKLTSLIGLPKDFENKLKCINENKLTSLEGCPSKLDLINLDGTNNLESYNHFPIYNLDLDIYTSKYDNIEINFLIDSENINNISLNYNKMINDLYNSDVNLSKQEARDIISNTNYKKDKDSPRYVNYFEELLEYVLREDENRIKEVNWPLDFINKQSSEIKNLLKSTKSIKKFNI